MKVVTRKLRAAGIWGTGLAVPERVLTNADLEKMVDTSDEWITTRTGIKERRLLQMMRHLVILRQLPQGMPNRGRGAGGGAQISSLWLQ